LLRERPIEAGIDLEFQEIDEVQDSQLRSEAWSQYVAGLFAQEDGVLDQLYLLGLEIQQLEDSFLTYATYPDVDQWPAPDSPENGWKALRSTLTDYVKHMRKLVPTFPADMGNDKLMSAYQRIVRRARQLNLGFAAELMELLELFDSGTRAVQKNWPGGRIQGK